MLPQHTHTLNYEAAHKRRINKIIFQAERKKNYARIEDKNKNRAETSVQLIKYAAGVQTLDPFIPQGPVFFPTQKKTTKTPLYSKAAVKFAARVLNLFVVIRKLKRTCQLKWLINGGISWELRGVYGVLSLQHKERSCECV